MYIGRFIILFVVIAIVLSVIGIGIFVLSKRKSKDNAFNEFSEEEMIGLLDRNSMKAGYINTRFLEKEFFDISRKMITSFYTQDPGLIPGIENIQKEIYMEWYERLRREHELNIRRTIHDLNIEELKITDQELDSLQTVSRVTVTGEVKVDYLYSHLTETKRVEKEFEQKFVFFNMNGYWLLEKVTPEEIINEKTTIL